MRPRSAWLSGIGIGAALGAVAAWHFASTPRTGPDGAVTETTLAELQQALEEEAGARRALADRVAELDGEISMLRLLGEAGFGEPSRSEFVRETPNPDLPPGTPREPVPAPSEAARAGGFREAALLAAGIDPREVARLRERWVEYELGRASIAERSLREGWFFKGQHRKELNALERALREELEDEGYDRYLYAIGKPNRLRARDVLDGSIASEAGLRPGDTILRYGGVRVFKPGELLRETAAGESGESVSIEILRNGRPMTVYARRGPLGVLLERSSDPPVGH